MNSTFVVFLIPFPLILNEEDVALASSTLAAFYIRQLKRLEAERQKMRLQLRQWRPSSVSMNGGGAVIARTSLFVDRGAPLTSERASEAHNRTPSLRPRPEFDSGEIRNNNTRPCSFVRDSRRRRERKLHRKDAF